MPTPKTPIQKNALPNPKTTKHKSQLALDRLKVSGVSYIGVLPLTFRPDTDSPIEFYNILMPTVTNQLVLVVDAVRTVRPVRYL